MLRDGLSGILLRREIGDGSFVPIAAGGGNRERSFAKNAKNEEEVIRYALAIFLIWRLLCSGNRLAELRA